MKILMGSLQKSYKQFLAAFHCLNFREIIINKKLMDQQDLFLYYENFNTQPNRHINSSKNTALNPWTQNESLNPYLNIKNKMPQLKSNPTSLKKLHNRQKSLSLNHSKSTNNLATIQSKQATDLNKISKQLPKLNVGHGIKNQVSKKMKHQHQFGKRFVLNSSPLYFSSPSICKRNAAHSSPESSKKTKIFPAVTRQLDVTRKIYLLQNKMSSTVTVSPQKKSKFYGRQEGDIRRLVEKQWAKKM